MDAIVYVVFDDESMLQKSKFCKLQYKKEILSDKHIKELARAFF